MLPSKLPKYVYYTLTEIGFTDEEITQMSRETIINAWLNWQGIIGYTLQIMSVVDSIKEE
jgi:hypothetical protein